MPIEETSLLIVDDDNRICTLLSAILSKSGYWVRTAKDGFSALVEIRNEIPDILLSDLNMPGMSGFELLSVVRRRFPVIQVIAMSSMFSGDDLPLGVVADAYYEKGTNIRSLLQILEALTQPERIRAQRQHVPSVPIWIPMNGHDPSGDAYVIIACPECLRTFPKVLDEFLRTIHETDCVHCSSMIHYAIVQPAPAVSQAYQRT
ncbi:MAG: response regulator transcription factor [Acidobacteriaceae bacterium]